MNLRNAEATWKGNLKDGKGTMKVGSGAFEVAFSDATRFGETPGTNPEELVGAAYAGCYSMALSAELGKAGFTPLSIHTKAQVTLDKVDGKARITLVHLDTDASVPGIDPKKFQEIANATLDGCPIGAALAALKKTLSARLV
jgi:osmotically inducible protein OsmC